MKSSFLLAPLAVATMLAAMPQAALAQYAPPPPPSSSGQYAPPPRVSYGYANVLRVTPVYDNDTTTEQQCDGPPASNNGNVAGGTIVGAIVGGVLGNAIGRGNGSGTRAAATAAGAVAGGAIGNNIARNSGPPAPGCRWVQVDRGGDAPPIGFDVEYDYKGDVFTARMPYDPGNRIRVRVSVVPTDEPPRYRR